MAAGRFSVDCRSLIRGGWTDDSEWFERLRANHSDLGQIGLGGVRLNPGVRGQPGQTSPRRPPVTFASTRRGVVGSIMVLGSGHPKDKEVRYDNSESTGGVSVRALIIYESMFGNTHAIADAIAKGLEPLDNVVVVPMGEAGRERVGDADLLVVGGPTHFHGMSRPRTRRWAAATAQKSKSDLVLDRDAKGPGVRDWLRSLGQSHTKFAAFDTRFEGPAVLEGGRRGQSAESFGSTGLR